MAGERRVGGIISLQVNGEIYDAKGAFTYDIGKPKRDAVVGADGVHGYKEMPKVPYVEGEITDRRSLDTGSLFMLENATVTLELANGKVIVLSDAWYAGEGTGNTEEGAIPVRFEAKKGDEI